MTNDEINVEELLKTLENGINDGGHQNFSIDKVEEKLKIPKNTLKSIFLDNDWSFIIKCHALIEAALNQAIVAVLGFNKLEDVISKIDTSNSSTGKVTIAKNIGLLNTDKANSIKIISEIRNNLVHNIKNIDFDIGAYYKNLDKNQQRTLIDKLLKAGLGDNTEQITQFKNAILPHQKIAVKYLIYSNTISIISLLLMASEKITISRKEKDEIFLNMTYIINKLHDKYGKNHD